MPIRIGIHGQGKIPLTGQVPDKLCQLNRSMQPQSQSSRRESENRRRSRFRTASPGEDRRVPVLVNEGGRIWDSLFPLYGRTIRMRCVPRDSGLRKGQVHAQASS
jgi:hypothetical protein